MARGYNTRPQKTRQQQRAATMAHLDRVAEALNRALVSENRTAGHFEQRMRQYARDAERDRALYAWLESCGRLPAPGADIAPELVAIFNREYNARQLSPGLFASASGNMGGSVQS